MTKETTTIFSSDALAWLSRATGLHGPFEVARMDGSTSSSLFLVQPADGRRSRAFVLRLLDNHSWTKQEPDLAAHEAAALEEARRADLRAPRLVAYTTEDMGFGAPAVVMTLLEGRIELRSTDPRGWFGHLAHELALIHRHPAEGFPWQYRSWVNRDVLVPPAWTEHPHLWERAIDLWLQGEPDIEPVFLHRDYHPTNVLWSKGQVSGVVDWINACRGPAGVDVAHCSVNLVLMYGASVSERFLEAYSAAAEGFVYHPYWVSMDCSTCACPSPPSTRRGRRSDWSTSRLGCCRGGWMSIWSG